ncbi:NAD-P-binding protein [Peniophora sp. CONT]|nr:NAD-P-binding protein [Peniophora sp. CONT]
MPDFEAMLKQFMALKGINERLQGLTDRHDIYPAIDPQQAFSAKSYAGKVVLITGASRGIGTVMATFYAQAGAKVALIARSASNLDVVKKQIQEKEPDADILTFAIDVKDTQAASKAVQDTVDRFGRIDVVVANAGTASPFDGKALGDREVTTWWNTMEVNMLGTMNFVGPSLNHLKKTNGYVIVVSSYSAHIRQPTNSDYCISKHALNRLVEFIALEYSGSVKSYAIHPGTVYTDIPKSAGLPEKFFVDTPELSAATVLALSSGKYDWLSGRFVDCTIDLGDVEQRKEEILSKDALVAKLVTL